jgi:formamidopyrimidine-DNA glycosylase
LPELPEVENARATLQRHLAGRVLATARAEAARPLEGPAAKLVRRVTGSKAGRAQRRGKQAFLPLSGADGSRFGLALHFGMTGRIAVTPPGGARPRHARLSLTRAEDGLVVHFCDARRFGRIALVEARRIGELPEAAALGPDPILDPWTPAVLRRAIAGTARPIKDVLMEQGRIAGIGNIYAAEALWLARLSPLRPADALTGPETGRLARSIRAVLDESLELFSRQRRISAARQRRADPKAFNEALYLSEGASNPFAVYSRKGEPCPRCSTPVESLVIAARSSFLCPACQR